MSSEARPLAADGMCRRIFPRPYLPLLTSERVVIRCHVFDGKPCCLEADPMTLARSSLFQNTSLLTRPSFRPLVDKPTQGRHSTLTPPLLHKGLFPAQSQFLRHSTQH